MATPTWTDNVNVVAAAGLAYGAATRGTLDLRGKLGARLFLRVGMKGTTVPSNGVDALVRSVLNDDVATPGGANPACLWPLKHNPTGTVGSTTVNSDSNSGQAALSVASSSNFAAGDVICVYDASYTRLEWHRVSKVAAGVLTLDRNLQYTHTAAQADAVTNKASCWEVMVEGGSLLAVVFDYGDDTSGSDVLVQAKAQTFDSVG